MQLIWHKSHKQNGYALCKIDTIMAQKVKKLKSCKYIQGFYDHCYFYAQILADLAYTMDVYKADRLQKAK